MYRCLALVARNHGLDTIKHILGNEPDYKIIGIFTHKLNPKVYDPARKVREDFRDFAKLTERFHIPLFTIDYRNEKEKLDEFAFSNDYDFLLSISWRYVISPNIFKKARIGAINIHRGDLPKYAGVEPIKKALQNNEKEIVISSHIIDEKIDSGEVLCREIHPTNYEQDCSLEENVERLKKEISPYFPKLAMKSFQILLRRKNE